VATRTAKLELELVLGKRLWHDQQSYRRIRAHEFACTNESFLLFSAVLPDLQLPNPVYGKGGELVTVYSMRYRAIKECPICGPQYLEEKCIKSLYANLRVPLDDEWFTRSLTCTDGVAYDKRCHVCSTQLEMRYDEIIGPMILCVKQDYYRSGGIAERVDGNTE
jgi:hypothetical protein